MTSERSSSSPLTPTSRWPRRPVIASNTATSSTNGDRATTMGVSPISILDDLVGIEDEHRIRP